MIRTWRSRFGTRSGPKYLKKIKERNIDITDEDLEYVPGQESELFQRLTGKLGNSPDDVRRFIESIAHNEDMAG